jgi:hypothetical protein
LFVRQTFGSSINCHARTQNFSLAENAQVKCARDFADLRDGRVKAVLSFQRLEEKLLSSQRF